MYRVYPSELRLGFFYLDLKCSTVFPTLLGLMGVWQKRLGKLVEHRNQSQPNPGLSSIGTPCTGGPGSFTLICTFTTVFTFTHVVRSWVCLSPFEKSHLRYDERGEEDEHHLCVHRLVPFMLLVQPDVLQPEWAK